MRNLSAFQPNGLKQIQLADTSLFSDANLVSYWKLEDENDSKGSNNLTNTSVTFGTGKFNNGAVFNAATDKLEIADNASLSITGALTINSWAKINTKPASTKYVVFGNKWLTTGNQRSYQFILYNNAGTYTIFPLLSSNGSAATSGSYNYTPDTNWHMYSMVFTPSTSIKLYIDGLLVYTDTTSIPASIFDSTAPLQIGSDGNGSSDTVLDDTAIFSRDLSAGEISQLYYAGSTKAYYPLNGNSNDFSGNLNTGTDTAITYPQGRFGQGARFNGSSSKITVADNAGLQFNNNFTISFWFKQSHDSSYRDFVRKALFGGGGAWAGFNIIKMNSGNTLRFEVLTSGSTAVGIFSNTAIKNDVWQNCVCQMDSGTLKMYIDGRLQTDTAAATMTASTNTLHIGSDNGTGQWNNGLIDEVIIESRAWTAKEVETYYRKSTLNYRKGFWANVLSAIRGAFFNFFN